MKFQAITRSQIITENTVIQRNFFSSIFITNIGDDNAIVNDNIPLDAGNSWKFENQPHVIIDQDFSIQFAGVETSKKLLVELVTNSMEG